MIIEIDSPAEALHYWAALKAHMRMLVNDGCSPPRQMEADAGRLLAFAAAKDSRQAPVRWQGICVRSVAGRAVAARR